MSPNFLCCLINLGVGKTGVTRQHKWKQCGWSAYDGWHGGLHILPLYFSCKDSCAVTCVTLTDTTQSATGFLSACSAVSFSLVSSMAVTCSMLNTFSSSMYITFKDRQTLEDYYICSRWFLLCWLKILYSEWLNDNWPTKHNNHIYLNLWWPNVKSY